MQRESARPRQVPERSVGCWSCLTTAIVGSLPERVEKKKGTKARCYLEQKCMSRSRRDPSFLHGRIVHHLPQWLLVPT